jgi:hypothetical protein
VPYPFAGWLEEHPDGGFILVHADDSHSPPLTSYEAVVEYLGDEAVPPVETVLRLEHVLGEGEDPYYRLEHKPHPPEAQT